MNTLPITLEERFDAGLKFSLFSNFKKWTDAFLELTDNAVGNRIEGQRLTMKIGTSNKLLVIENFGGYGMGIEQLEDFLQWGKIKPRTRADIGMYSQGGKSAMGYLGNSFELVTSEAGSSEIYRIEDDRLHDYKLKKYSVLTIPATGENKKLGFVKITVSGLRRHINEIEMKNLLSKVYEPLLKDGSLVIEHNGLKIGPQEIPLDETFKPEKFTFKKTNQSVYGWIGRLAPKSGIKGGIRCYKKGRLICEREFFGHPDPTYKGTLNFLFGEIHSDDVPATMNKTDFDRDSKEWLEIELEMFNILQPHIDDLLGREIKEPTDEERERVQEAKLILAELMRLRDIDMKSNHAGDGYDQGIKKPERNGKIDIRHNPPILTDRINKPATPPPAENVGKRRRLKSFMEWDIRDMDEEVRSIIEVKNNEKILVINNQYPGFRLNKGHIPYLIETASIQLAKPENQDEKISTDEYIALYDSLFASFCSNLDKAKENLTSKKIKNTFVQKV